MIIILVQVLDHMHQADHEIISEATIRNRMVADVAANPTMTCRQVYDEVVVNAGDGKVPNYSSVKAILERQRSKEIPPIPQTINDVNIPGQWRRTRNGERFCSLVDNNWGIAIFTTGNALRCLGQCTYIFLDGTFKTSTPIPTIFHYSWPVPRQGSSLSVCLDDR